MKNDDIDYSQHLKILQEELIPAMGCTEPIAIAYGAAKACAVLGELPQKVDLQVTANLIKNSKSVVVPNTGGLKGIGAAAAAGIIAGDSDEGLQVLSRVKSCQYGEVQDYLDSDNIDVKSLESEHTFDMIVTVYGVKSKATVQISRYHTNIVLITKDDEILFKQDVSDVSVGTNHTDRGCLSIESILDFAQVVEIADIQDLLEQQITYNSQIADEGLKGNWGANIGATLMQVWGEDVKTRAKARASAGSDARMSGCELPVMIVTGSGNQGITVSIPVIEYAKELDVSHEKLLRALVVSNLVAVHLKSGIGWLSAYCGVVSAGAAAAAGIAWLHEADHEVINQTLINSLGSVSGIICDGAKPACASKIAASVEAGILGFHMAKQGRHFKDGEGIVKGDIESTIANVAKLGRDGMRETDKVIIDMMLD
ncbi:MAG: serine dehydratase subunit alpha family protein [Terasakiella sp.]|uniref:L-cysteine desulfidase family protein n=1 Tax=unclassified Terasakiella TaxID=2614952 RepID=UPI003B00C0DE